MRMVKHFLARFAQRLASSQRIGGLLPGALELLQIDDYVGHGGEFRRLRYEEFLRVAADAQHFVS